MFQTFSERADPAKGAERLSALRAELARRGLDGFIVPRADEHQGEYVPAAAERLAWLTGFTGSAGTAVVLADRAAIFVDGRYTLQVQSQVDTNAFQPVSVLETSPSDWLKAHAGKGMRIGYDPWLTTRAQAKRLREALGEAEAELVAVESNPVDAIWSDRPAQPLGQVMLQPLRFAGRPAAQKLAEIASHLKEKRADAAVLTDPLAVAWAFNIRGSDVPHNPVPLSFAIVTREGRPSIFIESGKLSNEVRAALEDVADIREKAELEAALEELGRAGLRVLYDPSHSAEAVASLPEAAGAKIIEAADPVALPKARKNAAEIAGARAAHVRDGAAMVRFLAWLEEAAPGITEIKAAKRLEAFRAEAGEADRMPLRDISFDTISSTGPNGAIVHYRVTEATNRRLESGDLYLVDSGGQYQDGTTDVTRTVPVGETPAARLDLYRDRFTRVLKGHIAVATVRFPKGTTGAQIDALARQALWQAGLDFDHGTGHGVGSYLAVHEGPQRLAKSGHTALEPGMIVSNEPGYYAAGDFGIRIENLVVVREAAVPPGGERSMMRFETLTLVPVDLRLIAPRLMNAAEIAWLDGYHARVRATLSGWPQLDERERAWLADACRPLVG
ncbi:MAG TPA: aminopeptidase P family protein [Afifellaceae bacterium]|nr:aminopeptidase P family protein [Afifellaceae bacterium]